MAITRLGGATAITGTIPQGNIANASLGAVTALPGAIATGKVLQVVQGKSTTATVTSSTSFVATNLTASITPSATSSKIYISVQGCGDNDADARQIYTTLYRDSTNIIGGSVPSFTSIYGADRTIASMSGNFLDSPSSTSSVTYKVYIKCAGGAVEFISQSTEAHIQLMEIAG